MKVTAKRTKRISITKEIEILSHHLVTLSLDAKGSGRLWITLKRQCCICMKGFADGESVSDCVYIEDGVQLSSGVHTACLPQEPHHA